MGPTLVGAVNALINISMLRAVRRRAMSLERLEGVPLNRRRLPAAMGPLILAPRLALAAGLLDAPRRQLRRTAS